MIRRAIVLCTLAVTIPLPMLEYQTQQTAAGSAIEAWLREYDAAFTAKSLDRLASFYHPDVTVFEGGGINTGWVDYRDNHLGPELKDFQNLEFSHRDVSVHVLPGGQTAYVTSEYSLKTRVGDRAADARGLETLVLVNEGGRWLIRHSHTSSRRPPRTPGL
jgi:ketosteroid isomerase-like protein